MGYIDIQCRENIDELICEALSVYYDTSVVMDKRYKTDSFILNPRLNTAIQKKASSSVWQTVRRYHTVRKNLLLRIIMAVYMIFAFSEHGRFGCKYIHFTKNPDNTKDLLIMPGNMKVKVLNHRIDKIVNIMKKGYDMSSFFIDVKLRSNHEWPFILPLEVIGDGVYIEDFLYGCTRDRIIKEKWSLIDNRIGEYLLQIQMKERNEQICFEYEEILHRNAQVLLNILQPDDKEQNLLQFINYLADDHSVNTIVVSASHGDMQKGNIFCDEFDNVYILDWETYDRRSIWYDIITYFYDMRYRSNYVEKIRRFMDDPYWTDLTSKYCNIEINRNVILRVFLLEDIVWCLSECSRTKEKKWSGTLRQYTDEHLQEFIRRRFEKT